MFRRYFPFGVGVLVPFCLALLFNYVRYGHPLTEGSASQPNHPPIWGNPLVGLCGLLFSPGKSLFLFFPTIGLLFLYLPRCFRRFPGLTIALVSVCLLSLGLAASFSMWASDWAWGPRYLMVLAPIASLPFGMRSEGSAERKSVVIALLTLGLGSQVLGISVEHLRFFLEQQVDGYFWYSDPTFYYRESQFFARFAEFYSVIFEGPPASAQVFSGMVASGGPPTYTVTRAVPEIAHIMMRNHSVFYLPRPWPFWIPTLPLEIQPINPLGMMAFMASLGGLGIWLARSGLRGQPSRAATGDSVRRV